MPISPLPHWGRPHMSPEQVFYVIRTTLYELQLKTAMPIVKDMVGHYVWSLAMVPAAATSHTVEIVWESGHTASLWAGLFDWFSADSGYDVGCTCMGSCILKTPHGDFPYPSS